MAFDKSVNIQENVLIIELNGKLSSPDDVSALSEVLESKEFEKNQNVVFDCTNLSLLASSGLNVMVRVLTKSRILGGETILCGLNPQVLNVFNITKLDTIFKICLDLEEAINYYKQES